MRIQQNLLDLFGLSIKGNRNFHHDASMAITVHLMRQMIAHTVLYFLDIFLKEPSLYSSTMYTRSAALRFLKAPLHFG